MPMMQQGTLGAKTPFHEFICNTCGKPLKVHWVYKPEQLADVFLLTRQGRKPDGKLYCHRDQVGFAGMYYQRQLRRTMVEGYNA